MFFKAKFVRSLQFALPAAAFALILCAGGCAERKTPDMPASNAIPQAPVAAPAAAPPQAPPPPLASRTPGRKPAPFADLPLTLVSDCTRRDEVGYTETIKLAVANGIVSQLEARISAPRRGICNFKLADFRQTRSAPHVELLSHSGSKCAVRMWQQKNDFTVAFSGCKEMCTPQSAFEYVWPVLLKQTGNPCA